MAPRNLLRISIVIAAVIVVIGPAWAGGSGAPSPSKRLSPPSAYPSGKLGEIVKLGKELMDNTNTHPLTKAYVGNSLTCSSCHLKAGTDPRAGTFVAVANNYPAYSPREKTVVTLQDRILNCFMRSMNGIRPPVGGEAAVAMTAYITWLSEGYTVKMNPVKPVAYPNLPFPDPELKPFIQKADQNRGRQTYNNRCAGCHGADGQGVATFPPVWGDRSYNAGAGWKRNNGAGTSCAYFGGRSIYRGVGRGAKFIANGL